MLIFYYNHISGPVSIRLPRSVIYIIKINENIKTFRCNILKNCTKIFGNHWSIFNYSYNDIRRHLYLNTSHCRVFFLKLGRWINVYVVCATVHFKSLICDWLSSKKLEFLSNSFQKFMTQNKYSIFRKKLCTLWCDLFVLRSFWYCTYCLMSISSWYYD